MKPTVSFTLTTSADSNARSFILKHSSAKTVDVVVGPDPCGDTIASMFARFLGVTAVCNTRLKTQEYFAEGTALLKYDRFNHWLPSYGLPTTG